MKEVKTFRVDVANLNSDVFIINSKKARLELIKLIRELGKPHNINQFDMALDVILQFHSLMEYVFGYINETNQMKTLTIFIANKCKEAIYLLQNYMTFTENFDKRCSHFIDFGII